MAVPTTYSELCDNIATWMVRDDLDDIIPEFIQAAESRFNRALRLPEMEDSVTTSFSAATITLPTDFLEMRTAYLDASPIVPLEQMGLAQLRAFNANNTAAKPYYFALQSGNEMVFGPEPGGEYDIILNYYTKIPTLSDDEPTNWLLTAHPDLYRAAALAEGFAFTVDQERGQIWETRTQIKIAELQAEGRKKAFGATPLRARAAIVA